MKKVMLVALVLMFALSFMPDNVVAQEDITITWWITPWRIVTPDMDADESPDGEQFADYVSRQFEEKHSNVNVEYQIVTHDGREEQATSAMFAGNPPNVYWEQGSPNPEWVEQGQLEPITDYLTEEDKEDFIDYTLDTGKFGDDYYMWPWNNSNNGMGSSLILNVERFEERGVSIPEDRSWTMDEFLEAAQQLSYDSDGDGDIDRYAITLAADDTINMLGWLHRFGATLLNEDNTEFVLNSPEGVEALQFMVDMIHEYEVAPPGASGMGVYDAINMFHAGRTAMGYGGIYEIGRIDRYTKSGDIEDPFDVRLAQFPHDPEVGPVAYQVNGGFLVFREEDEATRDMAMEFARFITGPEMIGMLEDLLYITSRKSVNETLTFENVDPYTDTDIMTEVEVYLEAISHGVEYYGPAEVPTAEAIPYLTSAIQAALSLDETPQDALDEFVENANSVVFD